MRNTKWHHEQRAKRFDLAASSCRSLAALQNVNPELTALAGWLERDVNPALTALAGWLEREASIENAKALVEDYKKRQALDEDRNAFP